MGPFVCHFHNSLLKTRCIPLLGLGRVWVLKFFFYTSQSWVRIGSGWIVSPQQMSFVVQFLVHLSHIPSFFRIFPWPSPRCQNYLSVGSWVPRKPPCQTQGSKEPQNNLCPRAGRTLGHDFLIAPDCPRP